jgi:ribosomal protein S18 acetylase RimI-like enzyme
MAAVSIRAMTIVDYSATMALLATVEGVGMRSADSEASIARYLERNPGMSFVAVAPDGQFVGCAFGGHDGRRGYLYHLAVAEGVRRQGIGRRLVEATVAAIAKAGVDKVHADVFTRNVLGLAAWRRLGWHERPDLTRISFIAGSDPNA